MRMISWQQENVEQFPKIKDFYWKLIDDMAAVNDQIGWKKGIYPTDEFLMESLQRGELYSLRENGTLLGGVILNSAYNEGYRGLPRKIEASDEEVLIPHALSICPDRQNQGLGKAMMRYILQLAKKRQKKSSVWIYLGPINRQNGYIAPWDFNSWQLKPCIMLIQAGQSIRCLKGQ